MLGNAASLISIGLSAACNATVLAGEGRRSSRYESECWKIHRFIANATAVKSRNLVLYTSRRTLRKASILLAVTGAKLWIVRLEQRCGNVISTSHHWQSSALPEVSRAASPTAGNG